MPGIFSKYCSWIANMGVYSSRKSLSFPGSISSKLPLKSLSFHRSGQRFSKSLSFPTSGQWVYQSYQHYISRKSLSFHKESLSFQSRVLTNKGRLYTHVGERREKTSQDGWLNIAVPLTILLVQYKIQERRIVKRIAILFFCCFWLLLNIHLL